MWIFKKPNKTSKEYFRSGTENYYFHLDLKKTIMDLKAAITIDPNYSEAYFYLGLVYYVLTRF